MTSSDSMTGVTDRAIRIIKGSFAKVMDKKYTAASGGLKLLRSPSALSRARSSLAYLPDMSRDSLRGFAHLGLLATLLQSFLSTHSPRTRIGASAAQIEE